MPNYCTAHIRLPRGRTQNVTVVLHGDAGDRDDDGKQDGFLPTRKPLSLHLGSGTRSWRGGRVETMDGAGYPIEEDVMVTTASQPPVVAAHYRDNGNENVVNRLARLVAPNIPMKTTTSTMIPFRGQPLSSRWPLVLIPRNWRRLCVQQLKSSLYRLINLGIRAVIVVVMLLLSCQILLSSRQYRYLLSDYFSSNISTDGSIGRNEVESKTQNKVPVVLLPFDLPKQLNDAVYLHAGPLLAGTNFLVNETAPVVAEVVAWCDKNRLPDTHHYQKQYLSRLCECLCGNGNPEKSLHSIGVARNFWLEDLSPRWLDMAHAQESELRRTYGDYNDVDAFSEGLNSNLNLKFSPKADRQYPQTTTSIFTFPFSSSSSSLSYLTTLETNSARETHISESELQARLRALLSLLRHLEPNTSTYADNQAKVRSLFETEFVPRNNRLLHAYHRAVSGFLPDPNLIDLTWKGAMATFVQWEEWLEEIGKVLMTVRQAAIDFNGSGFGNGEAYAGDYNGGKGKDSREKSETYLALSIQTTCSEALGRVQDARIAADALVQRMKDLYREAETYSVNGWRVRKRVMDLEHDGLASMETILSLLESGKGDGTHFQDPRGVSRNGSGSDESKGGKQEAALNEQIIEAWVLWPVGEGIQEDIVKAAAFLAPPGR
ncbi:hypothetical protein F5X99DRAFT_425289 [Biscogniauxia marginata]|nr:hypothetical protein F5X99DRAFT_425289 [Biscogniauxia marginata]